MHQSDADATQMERAQNLANAKNIPPYSGTSHSKFSLISIPDEVFLKTANKLRVSMGASVSQISDSIKDIKEADHNRTLIMITKNLEKDCENNESVHSDVLDHVSSISRDIEDEAQLAPEGHDPI
jgi:thymidylate synthase